MSDLLHDLRYDAAQAEVDAAMAALESEYPDANAGRIMRLVSIRDQTAGVLTLELSPPSDPYEEQPEALSGPEPTR
ncbi:MAG: hypothetical protein WD737_06930 [Gemmatimonadota bacterium]